MTTPDIKFLRKQGERFARDSGQWRFTARPLFLASELCWNAYLDAKKAIFTPTGLDQSAVQSRGDDLSLLKPSLFLLATGIETLLKAVVVQQHPESTQEKWFYQHDLTDLASRVLPSLTDDERVLLHRLREIIEWSGRYPIPKWNTEQGRERYDARLVRVGDDWAIDGKTLSPGSYLESDWDLGVAFSNRLYEAFAGGETEA